MTGTLTPKTTSACGILGYHSPIVMRIPSFLGDSTYNKYVKDYVYETEALRIEALKLVIPQRVLLQPVYICCETLSKPE